MYSMVCGRFKTAKKELKTVSPVNQIPFSGLNAKNRKIAGQIFSTLFIVFTLIFMISFVFPMTVPVAQGANAGDIVWASNFGGVGYDWLCSVIAVEDGYVAVGYSAESSFNTGDWSDVTGKGSDDATIVKFDDTGAVVWMNNFGGVDVDYFNSVIAVEDGYVAVGNSDESSFDTGDWSGVTGNGNTDAIIVKFNDTGAVVWMSHFGGVSYNNFNSVIAVEDGYVAVGVSDDSSFDTGDWSGVTGNGNTDAIIVKFDDTGAVVWMSHFGGAGYDYFNSVIAVEDGYVAVGYSAESSFNTGDWSDVTGKGSDDAIIVKFDDTGAVVWMNNFGGVNGDWFYLVIAVEDGCVAVGESHESSFSTGDWSDVTGNGNYDATIAKFDDTGAVGWMSHFGGVSYDSFYSVIAVEDGCVAVGYSDDSSFNTGDLSDVTGNGKDDAIIVKFNTNASIKSSGGSGSGSARVIDPTVESSPSGPDSSDQADRPTGGSGTPATNGSASNGPADSDSADNGSSGKSYLVPLLVLAILAILGLSIFAWWKWKGNQKN